jgi:hypothetical protein
MPPIPSAPADLELIAKLKSELQYAKLKIRVLEERLRLLRIEKFGASGERLSDAQLELFALNRVDSKQTALTEIDRARKGHAKRNCKHHMRSEIGRHRMYYFESTRKFALKHQYEVETPFAVIPITPEPSAASSDSLMNLVYACLKLIRPTREQGGGRAELDCNGEVAIRSVSFADGRLDLPEGEKLYGIRNKDLELLRDVIQPFLKTMQGEYWPFRMAVEYYNRGYAVNDGKARYLYWGSSALHALYSSNNDKITQRVKGFLGADTLVYDPTDRPEFEFLQPSRLRKN